MNQREAMKTVLGIGAADGPERAPAWPCLPPGGAVELSDSQKRVAAADFHGPARFRGPAPSLEHQEHPLSQRG